MVRLADAVEVMNRIWPLSSADDWDNVGLLVGNPETEVHSALLTVDITTETVREALALGANLIVSHHPLILQGQTTVLSNTAVGSVIHSAISGGVGIVSLHTNADHPQFGVSEAFALALGLNNLIPLDALSGHGRIGTVAAVSLSDFAKRIIAVLPRCAAPVRVSGDPDRVVQRVAVLAGSGASFLQSALTAKVDVLVTSDLKHHQALDFLAETRLWSDPCAVIDVSHWAAESVWLQTAAAQLRASLPTMNFEISKLSTDPWTFSLQA